MPEIALPELDVESVAAIVAAARPILVNRDPSPDERDIQLSTAIALELLDPGPDGVDRAATRVWIDDVLAFDGRRTPELHPSFAGARSLVRETKDMLKIVLDPVVPLASEARVTVRVVTRVNGATATINEQYAFEAEDRTAPRLVAGVAVDDRRVRLAFDEPVRAVVDPAAIVVTALDAPAVPVTVVEAWAAGSIVETVLSTAMTPGARYRIVAGGVVDRAGNATLSPWNETVVTGFRPPRPAARRFDLWSMLPKHNRRNDRTGDLARFIACLQEVTDLLLADIDRFADLFDLERAPEPFLDLILRDLGNPFPFELDALGKRRLAAVLVEMYRQKGTAVGIRNAVRFFFGVEVIAITVLAATALLLGESELGVDWELGPSDRFARYAFSLQVGRVLTMKERKQLRAVVEYLKPAHTHFVDLIEPVPPIVPEHWEVGVSELAETTMLH